MAKVSDTQKDRPSGWPPEGTGRFRFRSLPSDDLALAILWTLVVVGLLVLALFLAPALFGWADGRVGVATTHAEVPTDVQALPTLLAEQPATPSSQQPQVLEKNISSEVEVSEGSVLEATIHSNVLGLDLPYRIYLPPGYGFSQQRYPVLYLLHGVGGNYSEWTEGDRLGSIADALVSEGRVCPMLIVMPDGDGSFFMNWANGGLRWADYVTNDLVPFIDSRYRTLADKEHRAIGGMSMGGHAALQLAFNHPDLFSIVGGHSPSLFLANEEVPVFFGDWNYYAGYDPIRLAATGGNLRSLQIWLDVSEEDSHLEAIEQLHDTLTSHGINHQWQPNPGIHFTTYWIEHTPQYLDFYSAAFDRNR